jgi:SAM-dependent methyltransferase
VTATSQQSGSSDQPLVDGLVEEVALRERVRARYAELAELAAAGATCGCGQPVDCGCGADCCTPTDENQPGVAAELYPSEDREALPETAVLASLGCGNPTAVAELRQGETVLDLGSGGGIDVLLSAKRVGPTGKAYGLDMTEEMLQLARRNATHSGATNVEFLKGHIEQIPLPAETVDVVISNCVINLSVDKPAVFAETFRVLKPGAAWASATSSPRTASPPSSGPSAAATWAASPGPCPRPSTRPSWPRRASPGSRWPSPTRSATACTRPSSRPPGPPTLPPSRPPPAASSRSCNSPAAADLT